MKASSLSAELADAASKLDAAAKKVYAMEDQLERARLGALWDRESLETKIKFLQDDKRKLIAEVMALRAALDSVAKHTTWAPIELSGGQV